MRRMAIILFFVIAMLFQTAIAEITGVELDAVQKMKLIPEEWEDNLEETADFGGFFGMTEAMISQCNVAGAIEKWRDNINSGNIPTRVMHRDDALVLTMIAADALGYTNYNARELDFCFENELDYDATFSQLSWDYPYITNIDRVILLYFQKDNPDEAIGNIPMTAVYFMARRMDVIQKKPFLDHDASLNFQLDKPLTRADAIACVMRLYNSENLTYIPRVQGTADQQLLSSVEERKKEILSNMEELPCERKAYYVSSETGNDKANGRTPEKAWKTLKKVNTASLKKGDCVYFRRGDLWRGQLWAKEGVSYSAYGEGEKPRFYASTENGADPELWSLLEGTDNIWVYAHPLMDCGLIVFNEGETWAKKVYPYYVNGFVQADDPTVPFDVRTGLTQDLMFFSKADSILYKGAPFRYTKMDTSDRTTKPEVVGTLYLRCDAGNPGAVYQSIEFMERQNIIIPANNTTFNNLCLKYCGSHAIFANDSNITVTYCEIGWIGGSIQYYDYENGAPAAFGNGIESDGSYDSFTVTDNYVYQVFDAGASNQDPSELPKITGNGSSAVMYNIIQNNITYARNIFEFCYMPIEIFFQLEDDAGYGRHIMKNVTIEDNAMLYSGYGWASQRAEGRNGTSLMFHFYPNASENFKIKNNLLYISTGSLITTGAKLRWLPILSGNTYVQDTGATLAYWPYSDEHFPKGYLFFNDTALDIIRNVLGDPTGTVLPAY